MLFYITCERCGKQKRVRDAAKQRVQRYCSRACGQVKQHRAFRRFVLVEEEQPKDDFGKFLRAQRQRVGRLLQRSMDRVNAARWRDLGEAIGPW